MALKPKTRAKQPNSQPEGTLVLQEVAQLTGLPDTIVEKEIESLLGTGADGVNNLTLDQFRSVMLSYLDVINEEMEAALKAERGTESHTETKVKESNAPKSQQRLQLVTH